MPRIARRIRNALLVLTAFALIAPAQAAPGPLVCQRHLELALRAVPPSVSHRDQLAYDKLRRKIRATRAHIKDPEPAPGEGPDGDPAGPGGDDGEAVAA